LRFRTAARGAAVRGSVSAIGARPWRPAVAPSAEVCVWPPAGAAALPIAARWRRRWWSRLRAAGGGTAGAKAGSALLIATEAVVFLAELQRNLAEFGVGERNADRAHAGFFLRAGDRFHQRGG
jgi:hypothetical protein